MTGILPVSWRRGKGKGRTRRARGAWQGEERGGERGLEREVSQAWTLEGGKDNLQRVFGRPDIYLARRQELAGGACTVSVWTTTWSVLSPAAASYNTYKTIQCSMYQGMGTVGSRPKGVHGEWWMAMCVCPLPVCGEEGSRRSRYTMFLHCISACAACVLRAECIVCGAWC